MPETAAQKLEQVLDADQGKEGLQLPKNFEETFKKKENRDLLVKSVNTKFENSDTIKQNKEAIISACKTEINSWGESLPSDAGKVAVLYLYNALNGKTLYKEDLPTAFTEFKKNKTDVASIPTTGVEGKDATKTAELLKDGVTEINEDIEGRKLHIKDLVEKGALKERNVDIGFKFLGNFSFEQKYDNGKISSEKGSIVIKDKALFDKVKKNAIGNDYEIKFNDSTMTVDFTSKNPNEKRLISGSNSIPKIGENNNKTESIDDIKNAIKLVFIPIDSQEGIKKLINQDTTQNINISKVNTDKTISPNSEENKTVTPEKTTSTPTLKDQVTSIPALKNNEAVNKFLKNITDLESQKKTLGSQLNTKIATLNTDNNTLTTKQEESKKLEEQIKDTKSIDDRLARKTALDGLNKQKGTLNNEIRSLSTKISDNRSEIDNLVIDINNTTQEITDNKDNLLAKLEPTQRTYEKNIKTTKDNITKLETTINTKYSDSQKVTLKPYFEKWETQLKEQKTNLTKLDKSLTEITTVTNSLKANPTAPEKNLANNKTEVKATVATTEVKPVVAADKPAVATPDKTVAAADKPAVATPDKTVATEVVPTNAVNIQNIQDFIKKTANTPLTGPNAKLLESDFQDLQKQLGSITNIFNTYQTKYGKRNEFPKFENDVNKYINTIVDNISKIRSNANNPDFKIINRVGGAFTQEQANMKVGLEIGQIIQKNIKRTTSELIDDGFAS